MLRIAISWPTMARTVHGLSSDAHHQPSAQELASLVASAVQRSPAPDASPTPPLDPQDQNASIQSILAAARDLPQASSTSPHWPVQQFVMPPSTAGPSTATRSVSYPRMLFASALYTSNVDWSRARVRPASESLTMQMRRTRILRFVASCASMSYSRMRP